MPAIHPKPGEHDQPVTIKHPSAPTPPASWFDPAAVAVFVPGGPVPAELNGVPVAPWTDHPRTAAEWAQVEGQNSDLDEPPLTLTAASTPAPGSGARATGASGWWRRPTDSGTTTRRCPRAPPTMAYRCRRRRSGAGKRLAFRSRSPGT